MLRLEDIRLAIRRLRKSSGATIASVGALACGIGAAAATWSLFSAVLLNPLPLEATDRLFQIDPPAFEGVSFGPGVLGHSFPEVEAIRASGVFESIAAGAPQNMPVVEQAGIPLNRQVYFAAHGFFATLGIRMARGRTFAEDEDRPGAPPVAVVSDRYWRNVLNADPNVLGRTVTVSGTNATIIGVLPPEFRGLHLTEAPDLYLPLNVAGDIDFQRFSNVDPLGPLMNWIRLVARLRPGDTPAAAQAQLNAVRIDCPECEPIRGEIGPFTLTDVNTAAIPFGARSGASQFTMLLSITVGLLLLAGCLTVGMLLLVRTEDRRDELALCVALGATRSRLAVGIAAEAAVLCVFGAVLAIPVSLWFIYGIRAFQLPGSIDIERLDLGFAVGPWLEVTVAAIVVVCVISLLTSLAAAGTAARSPLQSRTLATPRVTRRTPRTALVAAQVAITLVLVTGAGLFSRSLIEALSLNTGIETNRIFTASLVLGPLGYTEEQAATFVAQLRQRLDQSDLIESVSIRQGMGRVDAGTRFAIDGEQRELPAGLSYDAVGDNFFSTVGLPIVSGRSYLRSEIGGSPRVALVSESLGRLIANGGSPLGHRISDWASIRRVLMGQGSPDYLEVIGVVPDLITGVNDTEPLVVYQPLPADAPVGVTGTPLFVRASGNADNAIRTTIAAAKAMDPRVTLRGVMTLDEMIRQQMSPQRFGIRILGALGGMALLLTVLGTYTIAESLVVRRRRELGIRAALGAGRAHLRRLVLSDTARLVGIGLAAGLVLTVMGARLIRSLLYRVQPLDPLVLATVCAVILGLALLVSLRPAFEATRIDVTRSLREE